MNSESSSSSIQIEERHSSDAANSNDVVVQEVEYAPSVGPKTIIDEDGFEHGCAFLGRNEDEWDFKPFILNFEGLSKTLTAEDGNGLQKMWNTIRSK